MLPLSAREVDQQPQSGCPKDQLFPITVCVRCCLVTTLLQSAVHGPGGVSMVWLTSPAGADQLQLLGMHLHGKIKKSGSPGHATTPRRQPPRTRMRLDPWPPPDHHSSRASYLRRREILCVESTVHVVNSNRVQILGKIRLDWFVISLNLEIGFLRVKSAHLYKDGIVSLLIKQGRRINPKSPHSLKLSEQQGLPCPLSCPSRWSSRARPCSLACLYPNDPIPITHDAYATRR